MATTPNERTIEVPYSKWKLIRLLLIGLVFVGLGLLLILKHSKFEPPAVVHHSETEMLIVGYASVIFFSTCVVIVFIKLFSNKPGLIINHFGITINPGSFFPSTIAWTQIETLGIISISRTWLIAVYIKNPEEFISHINNFAMRKMASFSLTTYGTPVSITSSGLKYDTDELYALLMNRLINQ